MSVIPNSRLGNYDIVALIGAGGMGEVYRAWDDRLKREVAIKLLPAGLAHDKERAARLEREAQTLASLNHPHIATIHELAESGDVRFLVLELVEGRTLAEHLAHGPMSTVEGLRIARQIIDALDAAHEKGVVHRDLKPTNVMLTLDGAVKVLDFGLAKLTAGDTVASGASGLTASRATMASMAGTLLGTAAYMSPEQAAGKPVDKRADIWALGVVLYEMLTGRSPFQAATLQETLAGVLKEEPDLSRVPEQIRPLLKRCLCKDPKRRLRDIGDAALLLDEAPTPRAKASDRRVGWLWPALTTVFGIAAAAAIWAPSRPAPEIARFQIAMPEDGTFAGSLELSPDGRKLVFAAQGRDGRRRLWIRDIDSLTARPIPGTELETDFGGAVSWSPDNRFIAFSDGNRLLRVDASSSAPPLRIAELPGSPMSSGDISWNADGVILISSGGPIWRVPEVGGEVTAVTALAGSERRHGLPRFLPDGRRFLYFRGGSGVFVGSLDVTPDGQAAEPLLASDSQAIYVPSETGPGWLLFVRQGRLLAQTFDSTSLALTGDPVMVAPSVGALGVVGSRAFFTASASGALAYRGGREYQFTWVDRMGSSLGPVAESTEASFARVSPDGSHLAFDRVDEVGGVDIWLAEFGRDVMRRVTFDAARDEFPIWSPDGSRILFRSNRSGVFDLYETAADGTGDDRLVLATGLEKWPDDWSHDGRYVIFEERGAQDDLWLLPMNGDRTPVALTRTPFSENLAQLSPDDRWIAYQSTRSGPWEVYIQPFVPPGTTATGLGGIYQVSRGGGQRPLWRPDGRELTYIAPNGAVVSVDVTTDPRIQTGAPEPLFQMPAVDAAAAYARLEVHPDGQRFLVKEPVLDEARGGITVVLNWQAALRR